jgi:dephospho-CoA kinase
VLVIGLTGGVGSGKSEVSRRFADLGIPVVDTDVIARELVEPGAPALDEIVSGFGRAVLRADGTLDRRHLRDIVFADDARRRQLEDILHPRIRTRVEEMITGLRAPYAIVVIPLLIETRYPIAVDRVLVVDTPEELQVRRVMARDRVSGDKARAILAHQVPRARRLAVADDVIVNTGNLDALDREVASLHRRYLAAHKAD